MRNSTTRKSEVVFKDVGALSPEQQRKVYKYAQTLRDQDTKLTPFFLAAIALHLLVLFGIKMPAAQSFATTTGRKYVEVTLTIEQPPAPPAPKPLPEVKSDAPNPVAGPLSRPNSLAAPGPKVDDLPPPVDKIAPEVAPPPPSPTPPALNTPPTTAPPTVPSPLPDTMASLFGGPTPSNAPRATGNGKTLSSGPISGTGQGGGGIQWSPGKGGNGHFYEAFYVAQGITWENAEKFALARHGYLATIHSAAENSFVFKLIDDPKYWQPSKQWGYIDGPWLGGTKMQGVWQWVNREGAFKFSQWAEEEPDNLGGNQYALHYYGWRQRGADWDDLNGGEELRGFVVEYDHDPTAAKPPATSAPLAPSNGFTPGDK